MNRWSCWLVLVCIGFSPALFAQELETPWHTPDRFAVPEMQWIDETSPVRSLQYDGVLLSGKPTKVFAYYATPGTLVNDTSLDYELPAVVLVHGGGGTAFREWAELWAKRGYAAIAMDLAGNRPIEGRNAHDGQNRVRMDEPGPDQSDEVKFGQVDQPIEDQWTFHAVAAVIRAHSLVRSFPEVDESKTAVTGISWGGYLTCIVAGVDERFAAAVPVYGCGFLEKNSAWLSRFEVMTPEQRERWTSHFDPSKYLPRVSMPILFVNGTNDFAYPLDSYMLSYDLVPGKKNLCVTVNMPHSHPDGWAPTEIGRFIEEVTFEKDPLIKLSEPIIDNGQVTFKVENAGRPVAAALHRTTDGGSINQRQWTTEELTITDEGIAAFAIPDQTTAWLITCRDIFGATVSSRVTIIGEVAPAPRVR